MPDMKCRVCYEPWDSYGVRHGDMALWESKLFLAGKGCPCCEGIWRGDSEEEEVYDVDFSDAWLNPPEPEVVQACAECEIQEVKSVEYEGLRLWRGGKRVHYSYGRAITAEFVTFFPDSPDEHEWVVIGGEKYCEACTSRCQECKTPIFTRSDMTGDVYDEGACFEHPHSPYKSVCVDCFCVLTAEEE